MKNKVAWLGHASFRISDGTVIYIDPWEIKKLGSKADIILVTHDHFDHLSVPDIRKISKKDTVVVATDAVKKHLSSDVRVVRPGDRIVIGDVRIAAVYAYNPSKPFHPKAAGNVGYIVTMNGESIYHTGDTEFIEEMKALKADVLLVPVGGKYTSDVDDAIRIVAAVKPRLAVPMHWGKLQDVAGKEAADRFKRLAGVPVELLPIE
ncbi:MAG: MBL fold metallo-hydrolase [Deltaproteobacteria bacterium]|nr:MBL fold metallo-hydrolase [Deltaproteobacteria bacterium]